MHLKPLPQNNFLTLADFNCYNVWELGLKRRSNFESGFFVSVIQSLGIWGFKDTETAKNCINLNFVL